jgi:hypothetical protein
MGRVCSGVAAHLLEPDRGDRSGEPVDLGQPVGDAQVAHAATVIAAGPEARGPAGDQPVRRAQRPARAGAEIQRENAAVEISGSLERRRSNVLGAVHDDLLFE